MRELALLFLRLGTTAFGGPAAHIAMMEDEVVRRRRWLTREQFLDFLALVNLIPHPNSTEMAIQIGYHIAGWQGLLAFSRDRAGRQSCTESGSGSGPVAWNGGARFCHRRDESSRRLDHGRSGRRRSLPRASSPPIDETFEMTFAKDNAAEDGFNRWTINGVAYTMTGEMAPPSFHLKQGKRYRIHMRNASDDIHPPSPPQLRTHKSLRKVHLGNSQGCGDAGRLS